MKQQQTGDYIFLIIASLIGFFLFLGGMPVMDGAEVKMAEMAREMAVTGDFLNPQLGFVPLEGQPPLVLWLQALSMQFFGINSYALRIPSALFALATVLVLYTQGCYFKDILLGRLAAVLFLGTLLPVWVGRLGVETMALNFFLLMGLLQLLRYDLARSNEGEKEENAPWAAGFWIGLACLTGGLKGILLGFISFLLYKLIADRLRINPLALGKMVLGCVIPLVAWYGLRSTVVGSNPLEAWTAFEPATWVHLSGIDIGIGVLGLLLGGIPLMGLLYHPKTIDAEDRRLEIWSWAWLGTLLVWLIYELGRGRAIPADALLVCTPAVFPAALYLYQLIKKQKKISPEAYIFVGLGLLVWGLVPSLIHMLMDGIEGLARSVEDPVIAAAMKQDVEWGGWEWLMGAMYILGGGYGFIQLVKRRYVSFVFVQMALVVVLLPMASKWIAPNLLIYRQGAAQAFFEQFQGKETYVMTVGSDPALAMYYAQVPPYEGVDEIMLREGRLDRPVYLMVPKPLVDPAFRRKYRNFEKLYEEGGMVFFRRKIGTGLASRIK